MNPIFVIDFYGKFDHTCAIEKVNFQAIITNKSVKIKCLNCHKSLFYRLVGEFQDIGK